MKMGTLPLHNEERGTELQLVVDSPGTTQEQGLWRS